MFNHAEYSVCNSMSNDLDPIFKSLTFIIQNHDLSSTDIVLINIR